MTRPRTIRLSQALALRVTAPIYPSWCPMASAGACRNRGRPSRHSTSWTLRAALGEIGRTSGGGDIEVTGVGRRSFRRDFGSRQSRGSRQLRQPSNWGSDTAPIACAAVVFHQDHTTAGAQPLDEPRENEISVANEMERVGEQHAVQASKGRFDLRPYHPSAGGVLPAPVLP